MHKHNSILLKKITWLAFTLHTVNVLLILSFVSRIFSTEDHGTILTYISFLQFFFFWMNITSIHFNNHLADRKSFKNEIDVINKPNECVRKTYVWFKKSIFNTSDKSFKTTSLTNKKNITIQINEIYEAQFLSSCTLQVAVNRCHFRSVFKATSVIVSGSDYFTTDNFSLKTTRHTRFTDGAKHYDWKMCPCVVLIVHKGLSRIRLLNYKNPVSLIRLSPLWMITIALCPATYMFQLINYFKLRYVNANC